MPKAAARAWSGRGAYHLELPQKRAPAAAGKEPAKLDPRGANYRTPQRTSFGGGHDVSDSDPRLDISGRSLRCAIAWAEHREFERALPPSIIRDVAVRSLEAEADKEQDCAVTAVQDTGS